MIRSLSLFGPLRNSSASKAGLFALFFLLGFFVFGQKTKTQLEIEKKENLRKIAQAEKILKETENERNVTIGQLQALNQQIRARQALINGLRQEVSLLDTEINDLSIVVNALREDLRKLKEEYAAMIYSSYKANRGFNILTFLFSSETFNQLFQRLKYMEQYGEARKTQAEQIQVVAQELNDQRGEVQVKRDEQGVLLSQQIRESGKLAKSRKQVTSLIAQLEKKESQIRKEVVSRKKAIDRLDQTIATLVKRELEGNSTSSATLASSTELSRSFEEQKSRMQWPVVNGFISKKFGTQPHPVLKRIKTVNNGIDIQTNGNEKVRVVHDGEVKMVGYLQGMNNFVMVKHGSYYTVYSRLRNVNVSKGQVIAALDEIGEVFTDNQGVSEVHFEVWKNTEKLDPEQWLTE